MLLFACGGGGGTSAPVSQPIAMASIDNVFDGSPPGEPLQAEQWQLWDKGANVPGYGNNLENTGDGVKVALLDTGIQIRHPELMGRVLYAADYIDVDNDPSPDSSSDWHGTAVAGIIAAAARGATYNGQGEGGRGIAPLAQLLAFRVVPEGGSGGASDLGAALYEAAYRLQARVVNNSWTHKDNGKFTAIDLNVDWRENLEAFMVAKPSPVIVFAAGNGGTDMDFADAAAPSTPMLESMSSLDVYTNSRHVIAVGATNSQGSTVGYSETGANVLVSAPGGSSGLGLVTTDLVGAAGANASSDYMGGSAGGQGFVGTSGAAATTSGVAALMLQANPNLGAREVAWILADTASPVYCAGALCDGWLAPSEAAIGPKDNGNQYLHSYSHRYGFGRVNATAAVAKAETFTSFAEEVTCTSGRHFPDEVRKSSVYVPIGRALNYAVSMGAGCPAVIERVEVVFHASPISEYERTRYSGELHVTLTSPAGRVSELARRINCGADCGDISSGFTFSSVRHMGESPAGSWTLSVADEGTRTRSYFDSWELKLYGH